MIAKTKANKSFRGTTKYVLEKESAKIIGGNMYGSTTDELVEQFALSAHLNPQLKDPCYHLMLSVPKTDRTLSDDELARISERHFATVVVLSQLKGESAQVKNPDKRIPSTELNKLVDRFIESSLPAYDFFVARHGDKEHDHTHIVASRANNLDGKSIRTWNNFAHSEHSARLLEREFNLTQVPCSWESKHKAMTRNQLDRVSRDGLPGEEIMRRAIDAAIVDKPTMPELINRLWSEHCIRAEVSYYSHGGVRGIKYGIDVCAHNSDGTPRLVWKQGTNLNKYKYSFNKLQSELGVSYNPVRDDQQILALTALMHTAPIRQSEQSDISTPAPKPPDFLPLTNPEPDAETQRPLQLKQWAEMYVAYSRGLENLLPYDRDKEIAARAFKRGAESEEVEEIIAQSPVNWTRDEAELIASLALEHLEQEQAQKQRKAVTHQAMALPLTTPVLAASGYLETAENPKKIIQLRHMNPQQMWSHYSQGIDHKHQMLEEIATRKALRDEHLHSSILLMLEHSKQYQSCLKQYGSENAQQLAKTILNASIRNERQDAVKFSFAMSKLLNELGAGEREDDGSLLLKGKSFNYRQHLSTISLIAKDGRGEILRVIDGKLDFDKRNDTERQKCYGIEQIINKDIQELVNKELKKKKPQQQQDREISL